MDFTSEKELKKQIDAMISISLDKLIFMEILLLVSNMILSTKYYTNSDAESEWQREKTNDWRSPEVSINKNIKLSSFHGMKIISSGFVLHL